MTDSFKSKLNSLTHHSDFVKTIDSAQKTQGSLEYQLEQKRKKEARRLSKITIVSKKIKNFFTTNESSINVKKTSLTINIDDLNPNDIYEIKTMCISKGYKCTLLGNNFTIEK